MRSQNDDSVPKDKLWYAEMFVLVTRPAKHRGTGIQDTVMVKYVGRRIARSRHSHALAVT